MAGMNSQSGSSLIETLVTMSLVAIATMPLSYTMTGAMKADKRMIRNAIASELAIDKMEELAATDPSTLNSSDDYTESNLTKEGVSFVRTVDISVNDDGSRSVQVAVHPSNAQALGGNYSLVNTFPLWNED